MKTPPKNVAASVRNRLKILAEKRGENFDLVLVLYGIERLLYRLSQSELHKKFILKGAMLFTIWGGTLHRETRDLDLQGFGDSSVDGLVEQFRSIIGMQVPDDGIEFIDVQGEAIRALQDYGGARLTIRAKLTTARISIQVDVGFGSRITPPPKEIDFPTLLEFPAPRLRAYPVETVVAEKLQAMVDLGQRNSRLKDYFDLWYLAKNFYFDGSILARAIEGTFSSRKTVIPVSEPVGLSAKFFDDAYRQIQWRAFIKKVDRQSQSMAFGDIAGLLRKFLMPPMKAASSGVLFAEVWEKGGPWKPYPPTSSDSLR